MNLKRKQIPELIKRIDGELGIKLQRVFDASIGIEYVEINLSMDEWAAINDAQKSHNNEVGITSPDYWA